ncbi:large subunit GTPase 1 [Nematocida sp. LUAm1]|nr:large subunit GTPase 1 [Nematocida sp. LUAm2]KAI5178583.1 large subunit GTPase 1 [Nematocida sp. LUAm1]
MKTKYEWGKLVIKDRKMNKPQRENKSLKSILETTDAEMLIEAAEIVEYDFSQGDAQREKEKRENMIIETVGADLIIPQKPRIDQTRDVYKNEERKLFNEWKLKMNTLLREGGNMTPYERNLNVWRQLWTTLERSDIVVQIVDSRNPLLFYTKDVETLAPEKRHILLLNKSDLLTENQKNIWGDYFNEHGIEHFFYSAKDPEKRDELFDFLQAEGKTIGMIGYPNVGKSSTINSLFQKKVVQTSIVPGKTKSIQTLELHNMVLCDCPGLVFPSFITEKQELILSGILSLDHTKEVKECLKLLIERIGIRRLCWVTQVKEYVNDSRRTIEDNYLFALKKSSGRIEEGRMIKDLLKEYIEGKIKYVHSPPNVDPNAFNEENHYVPDSFIINEEVDCTWYSEERREKQKELEKQIDPQELLFSKKHYLKKGLFKHARLF